MTDPAPAPVRYLDPKMDLSFKRIFGEHRDLLISFLNALLPLPQTAQIEHLEYLTPEQVPVLPLLEKFSIVDVKCTDAQGRIFIVEMQLLWQSSFEKRIVFGASQAYVKQLKRGQTYDSLQPVYSLALVNSVFDHQSADYYHHYQIVSAGEPARVLPWLQFVFVELPKFKPESPADKRMMRLWLRFLSEIGQFAEQIADPELQNEAPIAKAIALMRESAFNEVELEAYNRNLDAWRTYHTGLVDSRNEGVLRGRALGLAEGLAEGKAEGVLAVAKALKSQGVASAVIASATGLSAATIEQL